jgi:hypothetical protein
MTIRRKPVWWDWELELTAHLLKRMTDRRFTEVDLRSMLEHARSLERDIVAGRWLIRASYRQRTWEVVVEPDARKRLVVVITAYPVED